MSLLQTVAVELRRMEWVGILLARLTVGLLFFLSGKGKLFRPVSRQQMLHTMQVAGVPFPGVTAVFVSMVEFLFGGLLVLGLLTPLACVMLSGVMVVALATNRIRSIHASSVGDWLSNFLYLPEVLYLVMLVWLFLAGPGCLSVDHWLVSWVRR